MASNGNVWLKPHDMTNSLVLAVEDWAQPQVLPILKTKSLDQLFTCPEILGNGSNSMETA